MKLKTVFKITAIAFSALCVAVFANSNQHNVTIYLDPIPYEFELPLYFLVFFIMLAGVGIAYIYNLKKCVKGYFEKSKLQRQVKALENENAGYKVKSKALQPSNES